MKLLLEAIERRAVSQPSLPALCRAGHCLSYKELNDRAWALSDHLFSLGVGKGDAVAVCLARSFDQIAGALAIMRVGAAYVPFDPAWPEARMRTILADCGASVLLGRREVISMLDGTAVKLVDPQELIVDVSVPSRLSKTEVDAETLAYIIYTSGSTGTPKGVEITHGNLAHLIAWHTETFKVTAADRTSHLAGLGFDGAVWEVWPYLAAGATVVLVDDLVRTSPELLREWLIAERVTLAFVPTALAEPMMKMDWPEWTALRVLHTAGDTLHTGPREGLPFAVWNCYGPTECTVNATSGMVPSGLVGLPTIGRPMMGTWVYVLDEEGEPVPVGEPGELCIGGGGVGRGYRNLPELTAERFVPDRFCGVAGARMYRTGDLGLVRADGEMEFHGRADGQVKIRGQRMELDEVISVLNRHPAIKFSTVVAVGEGPEKRLVAYVLASDGASAGARELQEFVGEVLPGYMVPSTFVRLECIPLNANGKLDKSLLPAPSAMNMLPSEARRVPSTHFEETVLAIIQKLLKTTDVGVDDDFFLAGGHSLMGTQLVMRVRESFGISVTLRDLFECTTAAQLAARMEALLIAEVEAMTDEEAERRTSGSRAAESMGSEQAAA